MKEPFLAYNDFDDSVACYKSVDEPCSCNWIQPGELYIVVEFDAYVDPKWAIRETLMLYRGQLRYIPTNHIRRVKL